MAELVKTQIPFADVSAPVTFTPATGTDCFTADGADSRTTLILRNSNTQNAVVTLKAGTGTLSPLGDLAVAVAAGAVVCVPLCRAGSARVKVMGGADKGKIYICTSVDSGGSVGSVGIGVICVE